MVYRRRYLSGQSATTVVIAEKAVTADKIADKAVDTPQLADDAIISEKVKDGEIKSEDIGTQEVKTEDIKDAAVTGVKIAESTIPESKLSFSVSARPLVPGVDTAEIQNLKVTATKLAADAVETAKIKDGAVNAAKLAGDAVENAKIKDDAVTAAKIASGAVGNIEIAADAVRGTEIQNLAVSTSKLSADAVETDKIKDGNVTLVKLESDILLKGLYDRQVFYDDFMGAVIDDAWSPNGDAGGVVDPSPRSIGDIVTGAVINDFFRLDWNDVQGANMNGGRGRLIVRAMPNAVVSQSIFIGIFNDNDNYVGFRYSTAVDGNWYAVSRIGAVETAVDTGIAVTAAFRKFSVEYRTVGGNVFFHIDDANEVEIATNKYTGLGHVCLKIQTLENVLKSLDVDAVLLAQDRDLT